MQDKLKLSLRLSLLLLVGILAYAACSSAPPAGSVIQPSGAVTGGAGAGGATGSGGATTGTAGATGTAAGGDTGMGGASNGTGGATSCMAYTLPRANVLAPVDPGVPMLIQAMTTAQKLAIESG